MENAVIDFPPQFHEEECLRLAEAVDDGGFEYSWCRLMIPSF